MMPFLYFPEDKSEYIPAVIVLVIFVILAGVAMYLFYKKSKKDEQKFNEKFDQHIKEAEDRN
jgi:flagellar basal body-associated protein FliL